MTDNSEKSNNAVKRTRDDLFKEIRDLEARLQELSVELEKSNIELQQFAYAASHDLKSPLVSIKGFLGLLNLSRISLVENRPRRFSLSQLQTFSHC